MTKRDPRLNPVVGDVVRAAGDRHARRLGSNLDQEEVAMVEAQARGLTLTIANSGHHWQFKGKEFLAEWWPSSAKLVLNKVWRSGVHAHDYGQVLREIDKRRTI